jgi:hypothetical protein
MEAIRGCNHPGCIILVPALAAAGGIVGGLAGSVAGVVKAEPAEKVEQAETVLLKASSDRNIHETLRDRLVQTARTRTRHPLVVLPDKGPAAVEEKASYQPLAEKGIDTVLEVGVQTFGLVGEWDVDPPLALSVRAHVRVVRAGSGETLYDHDLEYRGGGRTFAAWAGQDAGPYCRELESACQALADKIVEELFLLYQIPAAVTKTGDHYGKSPLTLW